MAQFVRQSKFRHVYGQALKKEQCYDNVRITKSAWDGPFCVANPKWLAVLSDANGSSAFYVIDLNKTGRLDVEMPMVSGHKGPVLELQWCPHDDDVIASAGEDCVVKIWRIPSEGLTKNLVDPVVSLPGHQRRVGALLWHPTAANVLLSAGQEGRLIVWDVSKGTASIVFDLPSYVVSMSFNYIGSKLAVTCKDKFLRVVDIRNKKILQEGQAHEGSKPSICTYVRDDQIFTTGFSKMSKRCYSLWNDKDLSKPIMSDEIDSSNGTLFPYYDYDLSLLFLIGKGDSQIRYFEVTNEAPFVHFLSLYSSNEPQRGFGYMPKRGVNVMVNEVVRIFKMHSKNWVEAIQFMVPRKSEMFQDDLYPDTLSDVPALSADQWLAGQDAAPILISMRETGNYGPGKPGPNRILTHPVANNGQAPPSSFADPHQSARWSAFTPSNSNNNSTNNLQVFNGPDSSQGSRSHSKEPSPASVVAPVALPRVASVAEPPHTNGNHSNGSVQPPQPQSVPSSLQVLGQDNESDSRTSPAPAIPPARDPNPRPTDSNIINTNTTTTTHQQQVTTTTSPCISPQIHQQLLDTIAGLTAQLQQLTSQFASVEQRLEHVEKLLENKANSNQPPVEKIIENKTTSSDETKPAAVLPEPLDNNNNNNVTQPSEKQPDPVVKEDEVKTEIPQTPPPISNSEPVKSEEIAKKENDLKIEGDQVPPSPLIEF